VAAARDAADPREVLTTLLLAERLRAGRLEAPEVGIYPIVTFEKQVLIMIGNLV
jgi:hypothetical protein